MRQGPAVVHDDRCTGCLVRSNATYGEPSFDADRPLDADLVVVDETSMVDVILATKLVKAVAPGDGLPCHGPLRQVSVGSAVTDLGPDRSESKPLRGQRGSLDPSCDLGESGVAGRRHVIGEGREAAVITGSQLIGRNVAGREQHPVAHLLRSLYLRVDGIRDSDENPRACRKMIGDHRQDSGGIGFTGHLDVEIPGLELEQLGEEGQRSQHRGCVLSPGHRRGRYGRRSWRARLR